MPHSGRSPPGRGRPLPAEAVIGFAAVASRGVPITDIHRPGALHAIEAPTQGGLGDTHKGLGHGEGTYSGVQLNPLATRLCAADMMNDHDGPRRRTVKIATAIL